MSAQPGLWQQLRQDNRDLAISSNRLGSIGRTFFLFPQGGGPRNSFTRMADIYNHLRSRDIVILGGVLKEQAGPAPLGVFDVTVMGAANRPRQATNNGVPTGGGATWMPPDSPTAATPLIELREQGWAFSNIMFAPPTDAAAIKMHTEETATYPSASHTSIEDCRFVGGFIGLEDYGGTQNTLVRGCSFETMVGAGGAAIKVTNQGIAIPQRWLVEYNRFLPCVNGIVGAWVDSVFRNNTIAKATTATINLASGNTGLRNFVIDNTFNIAAADFDPAGGVTGNATDTWINDLSDIREFGIPTN